MRVWPAVKTGVLIILVGVSLVLSEELWTGGWGGAGEVSYSSEPSLPQASVPGEMQVTAPTKIVLTDTDPSVCAVFMPDTTDYVDWLKRLSDMHVYSLHASSGVPNRSFVRSVQFDFGVNMNYQELIHYIPGLQPSVLPKQGQTVYLYQTQPYGPVMLTLESDTGTYTAQTDIDATRFASLFHHAIVLDPWEVWNRDTGSFVPKNGFDMFDITVSVDTRSVIPLIHSFFVNPQALTSVPESSSTLLWTDGSRAVWWDQSGHTLTYADPNVSTTSTIRRLSVSEILNYARAHGGAPDGSILTQSSLAIGTSTDWVLRPYVLGFPLLDQDQAIHLETVDAHVAKYQIPVDTFKVENRNLVHIIGASSLSKILHKLMPSTQTNELTVELGYLYESTNGHTAKLVPAYLISQSGMPLWEIDAVTGKVIKGMKVS